MKESLVKASLRMLLIPFCILAFSSLNAHEEKKDEAKTTKLIKDKELDLSKISEAFGHLIGKNLESLGFEFDMNQIIKGMQDSAEGKPPPMEESECVQAISLVQEEAFEKLSQENLTSAEKFLKENASNKGIVELEPGKLQYKVEQVGDGEEVQAHFSPLVKYTGRFLDGKVFGSSHEDEMISLDETIQGFSKGLVGMKEGEKRTLYIHPEMGYGTAGYLPPNSLLTFEIEIVKANAPQEQQDIVSTQVPEDEVADADLKAEPMDEKVVR